MVRSLTVGTRLIRLAGILDSLNWRYILNYISLIVDMQFIFNFISLTGAIENHLAEQGTASFDLPSYVDYFFWIEP